MNDIHRTNDIDLAPVQRESLWDQSKRALRRSRALSMLLVLLALLALAGLGWFLAHRNAAREQFQQFGNGRFRSAATVGFAVASPADIPINLEALGTVTPLATAVVAPQVSGVLAQILYKEGDYVKAGQPLAQIDPRPFQAALEQAQGNLARDEANLANQRVIVERSRLLLKQDSIAQQEVDTDVATQKQLEGAVLADRAAVDTARLNLTWSRVTAPISGKVGLRPVDVGNFVSAGSATGIATITQTMPIDVVFTLPADTVSRIQQRLAAGAQLPVTVLDRTRTVELGDGKFSTLDNQIDSQTGTIRAKARFGNEKGLLFPQQFVNIRLLLDTLSSAIVVPSPAVRHGPQGDYVYVIDADRSAHIRAVKVGPAANDRISIASGLAQGEQVVTEGGDRLVDGATVRLPGDAPPPQGRPGGWRGTQSGAGAGAGANANPSANPNANPSAGPNAWKARRRQHQQQPEQ
jgi:multidrug efflux system membrane fusion protein